MCGHMRQRRHGDGGLEAEVEVEAAAHGSGSERDRRAEGTCSVQRPKIWSAVRAVPVRLKDTEGHHPPARAPFAAPWPVGTGRR